MLREEPNSAGKRARASSQGLTKNAKKKEKEKMEAVGFVGVMEFWGLPSSSLTISFVQETISFSEHD